MNMTSSVSILASEKITLQHNLIETAVGVGSWGMTALRNVFLNIKSFDFLLGISTTMFLMTFYTLWSVQSLS